MPPLEAATRGDTSPRKNRPYSSVEADDSSDEWGNSRDDKAVEGDSMIQMEKVPMRAMKSLFVIFTPGVSVQTRRAFEELDKLLKASQALSRSNQAMLYRNFQDGLDPKIIDKAFMATVDILIALVDPNTANAAAKLKGRLAVHETAITPPRMTDTQFPASSIVLALEEAMLDLLRTLVCIVYELLGTNGRQPPGSANAQKEQALDDQLKFLLDKANGMDTLFPPGSESTPVDLHHDAAAILQSLSQRAFEDGHARTAERLIETCDSLFQRALMLAARLNVTTFVDDKTRQKWECFRHHPTNNAFLALRYAIDVTLLLDPVSEESSAYLEKCGELLTKLSRVRNNDHAGAIYVLIATQAYLCASLRMRRHDASLTIKALQSVSMNIQQNFVDVQSTAIFGGQTPGAIEWSSSPQHAIALGELALALLQFGDSETIEIEFKNHKGVFASFAEVQEFSDRCVFLDEPHMEALAVVCLLAFERAGDSPWIQPRLKLMSHLWSVVALSTIGDMSGIDVTTRVQLHLIKCDFSELSSAVNFKSARWQLMAPALARWLAPNRDTLLPELRANLPFGATP